jgi:hypothetical protein
MRCRFSFVTIVAIGLAVLSAGPGWSHTPDSDSTESVFANNLGIRTYSQLSSPVHNDPQVRGTQVTITATSPTKAVFRNTSAPGGGARAYRAWAEFKIGADSETLKTQASDLLEFGLTGGNTYTHLAGTLTVVWEIPGDQWSTHAFVNARAWPDGNPGGAVVGPHEHYMEMRDP